MVGPLRVSAPGAARRQDVAAAAGDARDPARGQVSRGGFLSGNTLVWVPGARAHLDDAVAAADLARAKVAPERALAVSRSMVARSGEYTRSSRRTSCRTGARRGRTSWTCAHHSHAAARPVLETSTSTSTGHEHGWFGAGAQPPSEGWPTELVIEVQLDHERLDCYSVAVALDRLIVGLAKRRGHAWLWDQALRASGSTALNVGEACGREGADRVRCFRIARGSALETDVALTLLAHRGACSDEHRRSARELSVRIVEMLTRLTR